MSNPAVWFFSDPHAYHKNIVKGISGWPDTSGCRDFPDQESHVKWLWKLLNDNVKPKDVLWCLGDWSFGGEMNIARFRSGINCGDIHLILGNHDHHLLKAQDDPQKYGLHSIQHYAELELGKTQLVLSHYPFESWVNMERGAYHLHGHCHGNMRQIDGRYDVGVDAYGPISIADIRKLPTAKGKFRHFKDSNGRRRKLTGGNHFGT